MAPSLLKGGVQFAFAVAISYPLVSILTDFDVQDAAQYRRNMEVGVYDVDTGDTKFSLFAILVRFLQHNIGAEDPFFVIGIFVCSAYIICAMRMKLNYDKYFMFFLLLIMPTISINYTQVLRQGVASALILPGMFIAFPPLSIALLGLGAMMHQMYAPFVLTLLIRRFMFGFQAPGETWKRKYTLGIWFDRCIVTALPILMLLVYSYSNVILSDDYTAIYFSSSDSNLKRFLVSILLFICVYLLMGMRPTPMNVFSSYLLTSIAALLPFVYDFLRLQTFATPFVLFAILEARFSLRVRFIFGISLIIALYVSPIAGLSQIF